MGGGNRLTGSDGLVVEGDSDGVLGAGGADECYLDDWWSCILGGWEGVGGGEVGYCREDGGESHGE